ncbi:hypothetical protein BDV28DRAFT_152920 [Aspergillus coremiiformis]|uniref:Uncharacterized protein n=1 Tax=Aspergillus coremiiformis TaxID=138285 RepID=A0A5N6YS71_9EURO|nr:hypothetical protein BDV28DRAFT_152920 [Aspergillus coremiiformis]
MSLNAVCSFSSTTKKNLLKLIGKVTLEDVQTLNSPDGERWVSSVQKIRDKVEDLYDNVAEYEIQGGKAHKSKKDPTDPDDIITIGFYSKSGTRLLSGHVHANGSYKLAESRAGRGQGKSQGKD